MSLDVQSISLDISKQPTPQQVRLGQGDANATQLIVSVFDDGEVYSLDDYTVRLSLRLPNDGGYYNVNGAKSGNVATFDIDEQYAASVSGFDGFGYVDIMDGETVICSTSRFQLVVLQNASDGVELAPQYIDAVQDAIDRANAAAEAAEGVVLQDVPLMSATVRGGAQLGDGLEIVDGKLTATGESYELPTMSASTKGGAKLGSGLSVANDTLSLSDESFTTSEKTKLAGIEDGANNYALPTMGTSTKGGAKLGAGLSVSNDVLSVDVSSIDGALPVAHGGTGADNAADARTNLGAASASDVSLDGGFTLVTGVYYQKFGKLVVLTFSGYQTQGFGVVGTLPVGYRPQRYTAAPAYASTSGYIDAAIDGTVQVSAAGSVFGVIVFFTS